MELSQDQYTDTKKVCIFCGSRNSNNAELKIKIEEVVNLFAKNNIDLVYGGSKRGTMGFVSEIFRKEGRSITGILPFKKLANETASDSLAQTIYTENLFDRKRKMIELSDYFLILPGGVGTLDETFEIITSNRMKFTDKKVALFNCLGYYDDLINQMNKMVDFNFLSKNIWDEVIVEADAHKLFERMTG